MKNKAFSNWSDEDTSEFDQDESRNICFMAIGESSQVRTDFCRNCLKRSFENIRAIKDEKKALKIKLEVCVVERDLLDQLTNLFKNTQKSSKENKSVFSYKSTSSQSEYFNLFESDKTSKNSCYYCEKTSHTYSRYRFRHSRPSNMVWKANNCSNQKGPKIVWVPNNE